MESYASVTRKVVVCVSYEVGIIDKKIGCSCNV